MLVVGASGLVGGRLLAGLSGDTRFRVRAASRVDRKWPARIEGVVIDPAAADGLQAACEGADTVVNLASMTDAACAADPGGALRANAGGTRTLVGAAIAAGITRFVQVSTAKVYGNNPTGVITESTVTRPESHYAITHRVAEDYAMLHSNAVVMRLSNGYGAPASRCRRSWDVMVNEFCREAATTGRITLRGDGLAWRNFIPLDDVVVALKFALTSLPRGTYNLGAPQSMPIRTMANRVAGACTDALGFSAEVVATRASRSDAPPLDFRTDKLRDAGVRIEDADREIRRTLVQARTTFAAGGDV